MKQLIQKTFNQTKELFAHHDKVLLSVSTGIDSMVLLEYFIQLKDKLNIKEIGVFHVNHGLREQSNEEEKYIENYCKHILNVPIYIYHLDGFPFTENSARDFRYRAAKEVMNQFGYTALVTAHHKDDQAETVLMRLIRGSRLFDLKGIKQSQPFGDGELIRPFLSVNKSDLPEIFHFEDETNKGNDYFRNRTRNLYIPMLETENPQFSNNLVALGLEIASLNNMVSEFITKIDYNNLETFRSYSSDIQSYFIQDYVDKLRENGETIKLSKKSIVDIINILNKRNTSNQQINKTFSVVTQSNRWWFDVSQQRKEDNFD